MVEQTLGAGEDDSRAHGDGLDGVHPDDVRVDAEGVPGLGDLDRVAREEPPDEGHPEDQLPRDVLDKEARLLQLNGDEGGFERVRRGVLGVERVDHDADDVAVAGGKRLVEDRPPREAQGRRVRPRRKQGSNARGVALVGGVMQRVDNLGVGLAPDGRFSRFSVRV